jgi:hypothetical protein
MANWVLLQSVYEVPVYVNLDQAMSIQQGKSDKFSTIAFPGGDEDVVKVRETPQEIANLGKLIP